MKFDIVTIFPGMVQPMLREGIVARAIERGLLDVAVFDLRDFTTDRHRVVDDTPFGGGPGMVLKPEPFFRAMARIRETRGEPTAVVMPTPQGKPFTHAVAARLAGADAAEGASGADGAGEGRRRAARTPWCCAAGMKGSTSASARRSRPKNSRSATTCCREANWRRW